MHETRIYNVIDNIFISNIAFNKFPEVGEPLEIEHEMYFVCERKFLIEDQYEAIGVIPLVVRNPKQIKNIDSYIKCLSVAHRRIQFRTGQKECDFDDCNEMIIS